MGWIIALLLLLLLACIWYILKFYIQLQRNVKLFQNLPQPGKRHWFLGHLLEHPGPCYAGLRWGSEWVRKSPNGFYCFWYGTQPSIAVFDNKTIKAVLSSSEPKDLSPFGYGHIRPWIGMGLLLSSGERWKRNRKLLTPAFHFNILNKYIPIVNDSTNHLFKQLEKLEEAPVELFQIVPPHTLEVLLRCAFSYDASDVQEQGYKHKYLAAVKRLTELMLFRVFNPLLTNELVYRLTSRGREFFRLSSYVHSVTSGIINKRRAQRRALGELTHKHLDFMDMLLSARDDQGQGLSDDDIRQEADTFLFEGHDTTASSLCFTLALLAQHPQHQRRCRQEADDVIGGSRDQPVPYEALGNLPVLTSVIKESLRLFPAVPFIKRRMTQAFQLAGYDIPAGTLTDVNLYHAHRNPRIWGPDAEEFRPERFLDCSIERKDNFMYVPFSAGPRNCIGQNFAMNELKITIVRLLRRFEIERCWSGEDIPKYTAQVTLVNEDPMQVRFLSRKD